MKDDYVQAYAVRGVIYHAMNKNDDAINDLTKAVELDPKFCAMRGIIYHDCGEKEKALADYAKAIELNPTEEIYTNRGILYNEMGNKDNALADYNKAIEINPNSDKAYFNREFYIKE